MAPTSARASTDFTWSGEAPGGEAKWSNAANWASHTSPAASSSIGVLDFPILTGAACTSEPITGTCSSSENDLTGLTVNELLLGGGFYSIGGERITLGAGGLSAGPGISFLQLPIELSADQTWRIEGPPGEETTSGVFLAETGLTGEGHALAIETSNYAGLLLGGSAEVGPVSFTGADSADTGSKARLNGGVEIGPGGSLNSSDGNLTTITDDELAGGGTIGPLRAVGSELWVGCGRANLFCPSEPAGLLDAASVELDPSSNITFFIAKAGAAAGTDYSQLSSTGAVTLGGANLAVDLSSEGGCPLTLASGERFTLISTTGTLSGTFANAPESGAEIPLTQLGLCPESTQRVRIRYGENEGHTVTATVVGPPTVRPTGVLATAATTATVEGEVNPAEQSTTYHVAYDLASSEWCTSGGTQGTPANSTTPATLGYTDATYHSVSIELSGLTASSTYCAELIAENASGEGHSSSEGLSFTAGAPSVNMSGAPSVTATTATVEGEIDPASQSTTYHVAYAVASSEWCTSGGTQGTPGNATTYTTLGYTDATYHSVSIELSGLTASTAYCAELIAENASAGAHGGLVTFTTGPASPPIAYTYYAAPTTATTAAIEGTIDPNGQSTAYHVAYDLVSSEWCASSGATGTPANSTALVTLPFADSSSHSVSVELSGLTEGSSYCAELVAQNTSGEGHGQQLSFTAGSPFAYAYNALPTTATTVTVEGAVDPTSQSTTYHVAYDLASSEWCSSSGATGTPANSTTPATLGYTDATYHSVSVELSGLTASSTYCAQLIAENASGEGHSQQLSFTAGSPSSYTFRAFSTTATTVAVEGTVDPTSQSTTYHVAYDLASSEWCTSGGTQGTPANSTTPATLGYTDATYHSVSIELSGLTASSTYCTELIAENASGTDSHGQVPFAVGLPSVSTYGGAVPTTATTATVEGTVNPAGQSTTYHVDYGSASSEWCTSSGLTGSPEFSTTAVTLGFTDGTFHPVSVELSGLTGSYCAELVAGNASGTARGGHVSFTTTATSKPVNVTPPSISGTAQQGQTLTEIHGTWTNQPTSYIYQWERCDTAGGACMAISGATEATYTPVASDVGHTIRVAETANNGGGSSSPEISAATATVVPPAPVNTTAPSITGTAQQGQTLTESHGSWEYQPTGYTYQWLQCDGFGEGCLPIPGATAQTYVTVAGDVGHTIEVQETASNAGGESAPATSAPTAVVLPAAPVNITPPSISGTAQQGKTLTESHGSWENEPSSYTYQWEQCDSSGSACLPIPGATEQSYVPVEGDVGHTIRVQETAGNAGGNSEPASSAPTAAVVPPVPVNTLQPTITGLPARQGKQLTVENGGWEYSPTEYTYEWLRCDTLGTSCVPIAGATNQTYTPVASDVGHELRVQVIAHNAGGPSEPAEPEATGVVVPSPPEEVAPPKISGTAQQGMTLTEEHGTWTNEPTVYEYQWLSCNQAGAECSPISGATAQTYVLVAGDVGHTIRVEETASNEGGSSSPAPSVQTAVVLPPAPVNKTPPTITGTAKQGETLTETHGTWEYNPTSYSYQWLQCDSTGNACLPISGAQAQTYVPIANDVGHTIRVEETATNAGGTGSPATSAQTAVVLPAPPQNITPPTVTGTAQQGQTLTEHNGTWTNEPTAYEYQWLRCDESGTGCTAIAGATAQTYVATEEDVSHTLSVQETASNAGGNSSPATAVTTSVVLPLPPSNTTPPSISGTAQQGQPLTAEHGTWTNGSPSYKGAISYAYQWLLCDSLGASCTSISGATHETYVPVTKDVGGTLEVQVTATNAGGSGQATSAPTSRVLPAPPQNITPPTVTGTAQEAHELTAHRGSWTNEPTSYEHQWLRCNETGAECSAISGATGETYLAAAADVGHTLRVEEVAINEGGPSTPAESAATGVVLPLPPSNITPPTITGTAQQGMTLTAHPGTWEHSPTTARLQWLQCDSLGASCTAIGGASGATYSPTGLDVGHTIRVQETAENAGGSSPPTESAATATVTPAVPVNTAAPKIAGTPEKGQTLVESRGTWTNEPTGYTYQWMRCDSTGAACAAIPEAVNQTYQATASDLAHTIEVQEVARNAGGDSAPARSAPTSVVVPVPLHAIAGENLAATTGVPVAFDGSGSSPASEIEHYAWEFGDGSNSIEESPTHAYAAPGSYTATLTVSRGSETARQSITVKVSAPAGHSVKIKTVDGEGHLIASADVLYIAPGGTRVQATTGAEGEAALEGLPDGTDTVYAYKDGYLPVVGQVVVSAGAGGTTLALATGEVATSTLKFHEMTLSEIEAAGIDTSDPANQLVYEFEIRLNFTETPPVQLHAYVNSGGEFVGSSGGGGGGGGSDSWSCSPNACQLAGGGIVAVPAVVDKHPLVQWLILRGKAAVLKQFFTVSMVIQNLSQEPFKLTKGEASLSVPGGVSLAPTASPQQETQKVPDIAGQSSATVNWVVRGDTPGDYYLSATYKASLNVVEAPVELRAALAQPLHVWGASALSLHVQADESSLAVAKPYHVRVGITNNADVPLYNVNLTLEENEFITGDNERGHFIFQPDQRLSETFSELAPGQTKYATAYILVPYKASEAKLNASRSSVSLAGEEASPGAGIEAVTPPPLYPVKAIPDDFKAVHLHWLPAPGAEGYEVFSTPNLETPFEQAPDPVLPTADASTPVQTLPASATDAYRPVAIDEGRWYAVSAIIGGIPTLDREVIYAVVENGPPTVTTGEATEVELTTATLNGSVDPNLAAITDCHFEYGLTTAYGASVPCAQNVGSGASLVPVSAPLTGLTPGTTYHYRLVATNADGTTDGADAVMTTAVPGPPGVVTGEATNFTSGGGLTLNGTVAPSGSPVTDCHFDYGVGGLTKTAPCASLPTGSAFAAKPVNSQLSGLTPATTYEYRLAATNAAGTTYGQTRTFKTCDSNKIDVPRTDAVAVACFVDETPTLPEHHRSFSVKGTVRVNGIDFVPSAGGTIHIDEGAGVLTASGNGVVKLGGVVPVWTWVNAITVPLTGDLSLLKDQKAKIFGFPLEGKLDAHFVSGEEAQIEGTVSLRALGDDVSATLQAQTTNKDGLAGVEASLEPADADPHFHELSSCSPKRPAPTGFECTSVTSEKGNPYWGLVAKEPAIAHLFGVPVQGLRFSYNSSSHQWGGGGVLALSNVLPSSLAKFLPTVGLYVKINTSPFGFAGARFSDKNLDVHLGPLALEHMELKFEKGPPLEAGGEFGLSLKQGTGKAIGIEAGGEYKAGKKSGWDVRIKGNVEFESEISAGGFFEYDNRDDVQKLLLGGNFTKSWPGVELGLGFSGGIELQPFHFQVTGDASLSLLHLVGLSGHGILSDAGVGGCAEVHLLVYNGEFGARMFWHRSWEYKGCDFSGLYSVGAVQAAAVDQGHTYLIPSGKVREELVAVGASGPPSVTLVGPHGETASTPDEADKLTSDKLGAAVALTGQRQTDFFLMHPAAGRWRLIPNPGAPTPVRYERADPLAPLHITARVLGRGATRTLVWHYPRQPGVSVRFVQEGGLASDIRHITANSGRRRFSVASGPGGKREIVAYVSVEGFPLKSLVVARFKVSPPVPPRTARAQFRLRAGRLTVTWRRVPAAEHYEVAIRQGSALHRYLVPGTRTSFSLTLARHPRLSLLTVTTSAGGRTGPPIVARPSNAPRHRRRH